MPRVMARAVACGLSDQRINAFYGSAEGFGNDYSYDRYALWRDHVTGSPDGLPIAPLLGTIKDYDGGATDLQVGPVTFGLMYCDHVVLYRFTPRSLHEFRLRHYLAWFGVMPRKGLTMTRKN